MLCTFGDCHLRLGISRCLLGESVRYDGGHKYDGFLVKTLGRYVEWVPVCPEVESGLPIPREAMHLVGDPEAPRLVGIRSGQDYTDGVLAFSRERAARLAEEDLHGFVFKKDSPSSGLFRVKVYDAHGAPARTGSGIFAREVTRRLPLLPVEEEGRLHDAPLRESFIHRVFATYRWTELVRTDPTPGGLVRFHTAHKLTLLAHSPRHYREMGRLVAEAGTRPWSELAGAYASALMAALRVTTTPGKHANVLRHLLGFLRRALSPADKAELEALIEDYRRGLVPLIVPLTLLKHHLARHTLPEWVHQQVYLAPYPKELMLLNTV